MKRITTFLTLIILLALATAGWAATNTFNVAGNASTTTSWTLGHVPTDGTEDAVIAANCTVDTAISCNNFTINANFVLSGASPIDIAGIVTNNSSATVTYSGNLTATTTGTKAHHFGANKTWSGTIAFHYTGTGASHLSEDSGTHFGNLTLDFTGIAGVDGGSFQFDSVPNTVDGVFTIISYCTTSTFANGKPIVSCGNGTANITVNGSIAVTGAVDFRGIHAAGTASWDLSSLLVGNCGGNTGITFRSPQTFYLVLGDFNGQFYGNGGVATGGNPASYATSSGGATSYANIPMPQDTLKIDNNTWGAYTGHNFIFHAGTRACNIDASGLTNVGNTIGIPDSAYGNIDYTGAGCAAATSTPNGYMCPRVKYESSANLTINVPSVLPAGQTVRFGEGNPTASVGTVQLLSDLNIGAATLNDSTLDLNGHSLICPTFVTASTKTKVLTDTAGGGKIIVNGLTGTVFDTTAATGLTVSNAPSIQIGDGTKTLLGDVTFIGSGKTYGGFTVKKHAGNYSAIINGANTFGAVTCETPDVTYQYSGIKFPQGVTTTLTSLVADGTASYVIPITSSDGAHAATLSDTTGTNTVSYCAIDWTAPTGGATWNTVSCTNGGHNVDGGGLNKWNFGTGVTENITSADFALAPFTFSATGTMVKNMSAANFALAPFIFSARFKEGNTNFGGGGGGLGLGLQPTGNNFPAWRQ